MFNHNNDVQSFKLVIRPGDTRLRNGDYWAIVGLCAVGSFMLLVVVGASI